MNDSTDRTACGDAALRSEALIMKYRTPAADSAEGWENESLPIGNGYLGANVFGIVARGDVAVFLEPDAFKRGKDATYWLPLARKGRRFAVNDWLYHKECVAKRHPVFAGLQTGGVLDWDYYNQVIGDMFTGQDAPDEMICAGFYPCLSGADGSYGSGAMVASYRLGAGRFILNTLNLCGNLDKNPVADRLLLNLVRYAQARRSPQTVKVPEKLRHRLMTEIYTPWRSVLSPFKTTWEITKEPAPEAPIAEVGLPVVGKDGWRKPGKDFGKDGFTNFRALDGERAGIMYARGTIACSEAMTCDLLFGTDGPAKVWLDGREVGVVPEAGNPAVPDRFRFPVELSRGRHTVIVAQDRRGGQAWGFFLRRLRRADAGKAAAGRRKDSLPEVNGKRLSEP